ncbi:MULTISPECIES: type II toxin-antitoxin system RelE/ParE family toxin [Pseudomonas]|uniref:Type II toxin-antitoxin system RelE/ParE family toxin n=1 Tax=Pseudomonas sessilinigenes TaxID=658629 RepID=A0ABX8MQQ0_9PSED|nr:MULTISPECIES: type II toxin-antitoxin system RelE/ParE family toxin [Pseudomonas]QIH06164.1 type II toxin-antitoxin system RelE/ParE family toxin [Pseudomonas sp. BIOMIG1BAC]QXH41624.1 type II toxin-antitoxin system RelE/ParE family toxin [Pseudomonas sessilinigenes]
MRQLKWTSKALSDLARLFEFLAQVNRSAAARTVQSLVRAPDALLSNPRLGEQLEEFKPKDVRRLLVGHYEVRYEIQGMVLSILRIWHVREDR